MMYNWYKTLNGWSLPDVPHINIILYVRIRPRVLFIDLAYRYMHVCLSSKILLKPLPFMKIITFLDLQYQKCCGKILWIHKHVPVLSKIHYKNDIQNNQGKNWDITPIRDPLKCTDGYGYFEIPLVTTILAISLTPVYW